MPETTNIATMSEKLSSEIFSVFGWETKGPANENWDCQKGQSHGKRTHPTDVCFWYENPYSSSFAYINTDLKSYGSSSISKAGITAAINEFAIATECAKASQQWKERHSHEDKNADITGMLFIYNHDGAYDKDFPKILAEIEQKDLYIPPGVKVQVVGPSDVAYLATVANDIKVRRGEQPDKVEIYLPPANACQFFYPNLVRKRTKSIKHKSATVDMLLAQWQVLHHHRVDGPVSKDAYTVYYRGTGDTSDEFKYILDFLFRFQLVGDSQSISIRMPFASNEASSHFASAIDTYFEHYFRGFHNIGAIQAQKNRITMKSITNIVTNFSSTEIGMGSRHG